MERRRASLERRRGCAAQERAQESEIEPRTTSPADAPATLGRGAHWLGHPQISGSIVGGIAGSAFVWVNAGALPAGWRLAAAVVWAGALAYWAWAVLIARRPVPQLARPRRSALWVYLGSVVAMVALMALGAWVVRELGRPQLQVAVVVLAVGLHFVPFAAAFVAPVFRTLGWALAAIGALGLALGAILDPVAAPAAAVVAGVVTLVLVARANRAQGVSPRSR
ncbi:hypothetical protein [Agrococcus carbonis]|uniref:Uncharacterized protein n=1 Tax=Agrococcus carbonis TaxID=684552 RepID=A0A1H1NWG8_9MICO|nr:hypothetical protein [Agrococcus carbonis]SDS03331.1 hypothetical protein SAMN04489719_1384 [Agrococcus carbonis]